MGNFRPRKRPDEVGPRNPIKIHPKNQLQEGVHASLRDIKPGDTIRPAGGAGSTTSSLTDASRTYFAPSGNERMSWDYIETHAENRKFGTGMETPRPRLLRTTPSNDQAYDPNYLRNHLAGGLEMAQIRGSKTPVRDAIDFARKNAPRTSGSQLVKGVEWGPNPVNGQSHVEVTLPNINWHQFGVENYRTWKNGTSWTDTGVKTGDFGGGPEPDEPSESMKEMKQAARQNAPGPGQMSLEDEGLQLPKPKFDDELEWG